jgi:indole-3-glycerol phosphate synthase
VSGGAAFVKTGSVLDDILTHKAGEVERLKAGDVLMLRALAESQPPARDFVGALHRPTVTLIAEVKKASPSKGVLVADFDPVRIGRAYAENGASCISVLVDERFFQGHIDYLRQVRAAVDVPVLFKEFVIDPVQVWQARAAGADAVLLIVGALTDGQLADLYAHINGLGMAALVEVHDEAEMARALRLGARLIGVNNRDLKTFREDLSTTERLAGMTDETVTLVAESAIRSVQDVARMGRCGARAVLVGEGLVKSADLAAAVREYSSQVRGGAS